MECCYLQVVVGPPVFPVILGGSFNIHLLPVHAFVLLMTAGCVPQQFLATPASSAGCSGANRVDQSLFGLFLVYPIMTVHLCEPPAYR